MTSKTITLAGQEYEILPLDMGQVTQILPLLARSGIESQEGSAALRTILQVAVSAARPDLTPPEFQKIRGVKYVEMLVARKIIGQMIGYYEEDKPESQDTSKPGEAAAEESA